MTGQEILNLAFIEVQSEATRQVEAGQTLGSIATQYLNFCINDLLTLGEIWDWAREIPFSPTIPTVNGTSIYTMPTGCIKLTQIYFDTGAIDSRMLIGLPVATFKQKWAALNYLARDKSVDYCQLDDTRFQVAPIPNAVYTMSITGLEQSSITDLGLAVTAIPERYHEVLVFGLARRFASAIRDTALFQQNGQMYTERVNRMVAESRRRADINLALQPFVSAPKIYTTDYWANPFVRRVN